MDYFKFTIFPGSFLTGLNDNWKIIKTNQIKLSGCRLFVRSHMIIAIIAYLYCLNMSSICRLMNSWGPLNSLKDIILKNHFWRFKTGFVCLFGCLLLYPYSWRHSEYELNRMSENIFIQLEPYIELEHRKIIKRCIIPFFIPNILYHWRECCIFPTSVWLTGRSGGRWSQVPGVLLAAALKNHQLSILP